MREDITNLSPSDTSAMAMASLAFFASALRRHCKITPRALSYRLALPELEAQSGCEDSLPFQTAHALPPIRLPRRPNLKERSIRCLRRQRCAANPSGSPRPQ
jgi:hypothetical protein